MSPPTLTIILLALALLAAGTVILLLTLRLRRLQKNLVSYRQRPTQTDATEEGDSSFSESLLEANLKKRFEDGTAWRRTPEKYRYAAALASQGADAERIAELLQLPLQEVRQLIALHKAAGGGSS
jgi:hypothetical protein